MINEGTKTPTKFTINDHITLKLESNKTVIYVDDVRFRHCKALVLNIPKDLSTELEDIDSIDELIITEGIEELPEELIRDYLTPEEEFWGHCSTFQAFVDSGYNTNLIGGNLAFSLLAVLYYSGDEVAKKAFKKEIVKRLSSGFLPVILNLVKAGYTSILNQNECETSFMAIREKLNPEELNRVIRDDAEFTAGGGYLGNFERLEVKYSLSPTELSTVKEIEHHIGRFIPHYEEISKGPSMCIENKQVKTLVLDHVDLTYVPECVISLKNVTRLILNNNKLQKIPESIGKMENLEMLSLHDNQLTNLPNSIKDLKKLKTIILSNNEFTEIPSNIHYLKELRYISLNNNRISNITENLSSLKKLEILSLNENNIKKILKADKVIIFYFLLFFINFNQ